VAAIVRADGATVQTDDLVLTVGWGIEQQREQKSGAISRLVMPGSGHFELRQRSDDESLPDQALELLGAEVIDVYLNRETFWKGVPEAAWDYKVGGFQVLRKWLSYREERVLGRGLSIDEARQFSSISRRLTELVLLAPDLDANYLASTGTVQQEPLVEAG
jgi:hypothetical protein